MTYTSTGSRNTIRFNVANQEAEELSSPLDVLLTSGGDPRLRVDPAHMLNGYGCQPWPRPEAFTFASSTATSISDRAFAGAAKVQQQLIESQRNGQLVDACDHQFEDIRRQLIEFLELDASGTEIIFSPSGTDSQIHALYIAQTVLDGPLTTIIVGSEETGSGTANAMTGCHFSSVTAQGREVIKGKRIVGFADDTDRVEIPLRDKNGRLRSDDSINHELLATISHVVGSGRRVVLHVMDTSKLGSRCPSLDCLRQVQSNWGRSVQVVMDACQMRLSRRRLQYYLAQNFMVFITGSKFLTGPPLSGALLVPSRTSAFMKQIATVPSGLELYSNRSDWPIAWRGIRSRLPLQPNFGQLLRWVAAVEELRDYVAVPPSYRYLALQEFSRVVSSMIAKRSNLRRVPAFESAKSDQLDDEEMSARTIFPFFITDWEKVLSVDACTLIYRALNLDVTNLLPRSASDHQRQVAARLCHIGQPVGISHLAYGFVGTLRISAGARVVSETWCRMGMTASLRRLAQEFNQVRIILDKIDLLLENFDALGELDEINMRSSSCEMDSGRLISRWTAMHRIHSGPVHSLNSSSRIPHALGVRHE